MISLCSINAWADFSYKCTVQSSKAFFFESDGKQQEWNRFRETVFESNEVKDASACFLQAYNAAQKLPDDAIIQFKDQRAGCDPDNVLERTGCWNSLRGTAFPFAEWSFSCKTKITVLGRDTGLSKNCDGFPIEGRLTKLTSQSTSSFVGDLRVFNWKKNWSPLVRQ